MKKKVEVFLEEEEIKKLEEMIEAKNKEGYNTSRSELIRAAVVHSIARFEWNKQPMPHEK